MPRGAVGTAQHAGCRGLGPLWTGCWKEPGHADVPGQSHVLLPGEPARESPLLKAKVRDTETGTAERGREGEGRRGPGGKVRDGGEGGIQTKRKNKKKNHVPAVLG